MQGNSLPLALLETTAVTKDKASRCVSRSHLPLLATPFQWSSKSSSHFSILRYPQYLLFKENKRGLLLIQQHCLPSRYSLLFLQLSMFTDCSPGTIQNYPMGVVRSGRQCTGRHCNNHKGPLGGLWWLQYISTSRESPWGPFPFLICGVPFGGLHGGG